MSQTPSDITEKPTNNSMSELDVLPETLQQALQRTTVELMSTGKKLVLPYPLSSNTNDHAAAAQTMLEQASAACVTTLCQLELDDDSLLAGACYPWFIAHETFTKTINSQIPPGVLSILQGVHELSRFDHLIDGTRALHQQDQQLERGEGLRRMLLAMIDDPRVLLVRLAWHLFRLENFQQLPEDRAKRLAHRTQQLFAPLANRLGIWQLKWQMEDLALRILQPDAYHKIAKSLAEKRSDREAYLENFLEELQTLSKDDGTVMTVAGRAKHIYSIWRKMQLKHKSFEEVSDTLATRVIVADLPACYALLGAVHNHWQPVPGEFDDYIAQPKPNGYQSLHTAVYGEDNKVVEVQIRSQAMHDFAELGIAAHWQYKEAGNSNSSSEGDLAKKINWLRQLIDLKDDYELESRLRDEVFEDRVYVFTPSGDIVDLVHAATPLDFAYHIHTQLGHCTIGAKVNQRIVPLTYRLQNGDRVEILASKKPSPSRDWLHRERGYLASARARAKVRHWFRQQDHDEHVELGEDLVKRCIRLANSRRHQRPAVSANDLLSGMQAQTIQELYASAGRGDISSSQIYGAIERWWQANEPDSKPPITPNLKLANNKPHPTEITFAAGEKLLHFLAKCCHPVPPEPIIGFITKSRGVAVHLQSCRNVQRLQDVSPERLLTAQWPDDQTSDNSNNKAALFSSKLHLVAGDRPNLLRDIANVFTAFSANVNGMQTHTDDEQLAHCDISLTVSDSEQLQGVMQALHRLPNVIDVQRV